MTANSPLLLDAGSSGLIDLNSILASPDAPSPTITPSAPMNSAPPLAALSLGPVVGPPPRARPRTQAPARSGRGVLYGLMAVLSLGIVGMGALAVHVHQERAQASAYQVATAIQSPPPVEPALAVAVAPQPEEPEATPESEPEPDSSATPEEAEAKPDKKPGKRRTRSRRGRTGTQGKTDKTAKPDKPVEPKPEKVATKTPKPDGPDPESVECLLHPDKCRGKTGSGEPDSEPEVPKPSAGDLPARLNPAQLRSGVAQAKAAARNECSKHAGAGGQKVKVKLSIAGDSGRVATATVESDGGSKALANCVAQKLKGATFDQFERPRQGYSVSVRF